MIKEIIDFMKSRIMTILTCICYNDFFGAKYLIISSNLPWAHDPELRNFKYVPVCLFPKILHSLTF